MWYCIPLLALTHLTYSYKIFVKCMFPYYAFLLLVTFRAYDLFLLRRRWVVTMRLLSPCGRVHRGMRSPGAIYSFTGA